MVASYDATVRVWDAQTGEELRVLKGHTIGVTSVAYSPDAKTIASASDDQTVRLWDAQTGQQLRSLEGRAFGVYSPNGAAIATASDHRVQLRMADIEDLLALADSLIQRELHVLTGSEREYFGLE